MVAVDYSDCNSDSDGPCHSAEKGERAKERHQPNGGQGEGSGSEQAEKLHDLWGSSQVVKGTAL